jgi:hypothetical protein
MIEDQEDLKSGVALSDGPVRNPDIVSIREDREKRGYTLRLLSHTLSRKNLLALTGLFLVPQGSEMNSELEKAGRVADYLEVGELMCHDALTREESCGAHFRERTSDGGWGSGS